MRSVTRTIFRQAEWLVLDPLVRDGPACCHCADVVGLDKVKLIEVQHHWFNQLHEIDIKKADDVFAALGDRWRPFMRGGRLTKAVFKVWFEDVEKPCSVTLRPKNIAKYDLPTDSAPIEQWLTKAGFRERNLQPKHIRSVRQFWKTLRLVPGGATSRYDWACLLQGEWPTVAPLLRSTGTVASRVVCPSPGGEHCPRHVRRWKGSIAAVCG